jgi:ABC-type phosphate/phosphonate transport system substrate-binding protein
MRNRSKQGQLISTAVLCLASSIEGSALAEVNPTQLAQNQGEAKPRPPAAAAKAPAGAGAQPADSASTRTYVLFAISEGASGGLDASEILRKYSGLKAVMEQALGREVRIVAARNFELLERGLKERQFDFAMARPADYMARAIRDSKYSLVATANPDGMCTIIVPKDSPIKTLADLRGKRLGLPEAVAFMSRFCRADLRDNGIDIAKETKLQYLREQDVVGYAVESGIIDAGGVASFSGVARNWEKKGGRILHRSVKQPYFPLIANGNLPRADVEKVRKAFIQLSESESGKEVLQSLGVQGFASGDEQRLIKLLSWLGD